MPSEADHDDQAAFPEDELGPKLEDAKRGERSVPFVDAAHFVYGP